MPTNHVIAGARFTLLQSGSPIFEVFATSFCRLLVKTKECLTIYEREDPGTVPHGKSDPGNCFTLIKSLDENLR